MELLLTNPSRRRKHKARKHKARTSSTRSRRRVRRASRPSPGVAPMAKSRRRRRKARSVAVRHSAAPRSRRRRGGGGGGGGGLGLSSLFSTANLTDLAMSGAAGVGVVIATNKAIDLLIKKTTDPTKAAELANTDKPSNMRIALSAGVPLALAWAIRRFMKNGKLAASVATIGAANAGLLLYRRMQAGSASAARIGPGSYSSAQAALQAGNRRQLAPGGVNGLGALTDDASLANAIVVPVQGNAGF